MTAIDEVATTSAGLILSNIETIRSFLSDAAADNRLPQNHRDAAFSLSSQPSVPYRSLRSIWSASDPFMRPSLFLLLRGFSFVFTSPKPREKVSRRTYTPKKEKRKLRDIVRLIWLDPTFLERGSLEKISVECSTCSATESKGSFCSHFWQQIAFIYLINLHMWSCFSSTTGLHVIVTMFSGYLLGYAAFRALFSRDPVMNAAGGVLGLVFAMLVETFLFIIRTSDYDSKSSTSAPKTASHQKKNQ